MKLNSKYFDSIRVKSTAAPKAKPQQSLCQWQGCQAAAEYRAPQGRGREGAFFMFCLDHVKQYNREYNYFQGMSDTEVSDYQKSAMTGHRPTWELGAKSSAQDAAGASARRAKTRFGTHEPEDDPFELFGSAETKTKPADSRSKPVGNMARKSLRTLNLPDQSTKIEIKTRFKELVKRHHPDANGGDRTTEDRLREIIQAYNYLKSAGFC